MEVVAIQTYIWMIPMLMLFNIISMLKYNWNDISYVNLALLCILHITFLFQFLKIPKEIFINVNSLKIYRYTNNRKYNNDDIHSNNNGDTCQYPTNFSDLHSKMFMWILVLYLIFTISMSKPSGVRDAAKNTCRGVGPQSGGLWPQNTNPS